MIIRAEIENLSRKRGNIKKREKYLMRRPALRWSTPVNTKKAARSGVAFFMLFSIQAFAAKANTRKEKIILFSCSSRS